MFISQICLNAPLGTVHILSYLGVSSIIIDTFYHFWLQYGKFYTSLKLFHRSVIHGVHAKYKLPRIDIDRDLTKTKQRVQNCGKQGVLISWWPLFTVKGKLFPKILINQNKSQPGNAGRTLPPPEGSAGMMQGRVDKGQDGSGTVTSAPKTSNRHRRALGGRRT